MNKQVRRLLLTVSGLLFAVVAPLIVLYAIGYRFVPTDQATRSVGVLLVETVPRGAQVQVDGADRGASPEAISGLSEGEVHLRLTKDGYAPWEKRLTIAPTRATEVRAVKLFAENAPVQTIQQDIAQYSLSPNRRLVAAVDADNQLSILDTEGEPVRSVTALAGSPSELLWSPDSTALAITVGGRHSIVSVSDGEPTIPLSLPNLRSLVWDPRLPGRLLTLRASEDLVSYSLATGQQEVLVQNVEVFATTSRSLIAVHAGQQIVWYSLQGVEQRRQSLSGDNPITQVAAAPGGNIAIQQGEGVSIVTEDQEVIEVASSAGLIGWSPDGGMILLQVGGSELAVFNLDNERVPYLLTNRLHSILRLSRPIRHPQWFAGGTHVVFQVDDEIVLSEIDTRDRPIQFTVDTTNTGNASATVGAEGFSMLYLKADNGSNALVARPLVLEEDR